MGPMRMWKLMRSRTLWESNSIYNKEHNDGRVRVKDSFVEETARRRQNVWNGDEFGVER